MTDPLTSWNDGAAKSAIIDFVTKAITANGPDFVPPAERIATFDNDGTLWLEKPLYIQLQHGLRAVGKMAAEKPEVRAPSAVQSGRRKGHGLAGPGGRRLCQRRPRAASSPSWRASPRPVLG